MPFRILRFDEVKPYVNPVPLIDISVEAEGFSDLQLHSGVEWIELPFNIAVNKNYFVCKVVGESMNIKIPNGSYCLFRRDEVGSRNGKIVLLESTTIQDAEFGSGYTVKEYHSKKCIESESRQHQSIKLKPLSFNSKYRNIEIKEHEIKNLKVLGVFLSVLE